MATPREELDAACDQWSGDLWKADQLVSTYLGSSPEMLPGNICGWVKRMKPDKLRERADVIRNVGSEHDSPYDKVVADSNFSDLRNEWSGEGFDAMAERWTDSETSFVNYLGRLKGIAADTADDLHELADEVEQLQRDCKTALEYNIATLQETLDELETFWKNVMTGASWGSGGGAVAGGIVFSPTGVGAAVGAAIGYVAGLIAGGIAGGLFSAGREEIEREFANSPEVDLQLNGILNQANGLTVVKRDGIDAPLRFGEFSGYYRDSYSGLDEDFVPTAE
ncbi:MAG: hypothetical protein ACRDXX_02320 [Stackebrandtia sp.]